MNQVNNYWIAYNSQIAFKESFTLQRMVSFQFAISLLSLLASLFLIYWSKAGNFKQLVHKTLDHRKLNNSENQADHLSDIAYFFAVYTICLSSLVTVIRFIKGEFNQAVKSDTQFVSNLNKVIASSTEHFFIFMSIYVYLLQHKDFGLKNDHFLLMPLWFLIGRLASLIQSVLTQLAKGRLAFFMIGTIMTLAPYFVMIGNIFGYSPLSWF